MRTMTKNKASKRRVKTPLKKGVIIILIFTASIFCASPLYANDAQMRQTLVLMIQQLEGMKPLISQAAREQSRNPRVKVHFDRFKGADGKWRDGLRQDVEFIQTALIGIVNQEGIEPRTAHPIRNDFIGQ